MRRLSAALALVFCACATNDESLRLARELSTALDAYEQRLASKAAEQNRFYTQRSAQHAASALDMRGPQREQLRARAALESASRMSGSPATEARAGNVVRFLLDTAAAEMEEDRSLRDEARAAESSFRGAMRALDIKRAELRRVRDSLLTLSLRRDARTLREFIDQLRKELELADQP
jgi:hypothetical protein